MMSKSGEPLRRKIDFETLTKIEELVERMHELELQVNGNKNSIESINKTLDGRSGIVNSLTTLKEDFHQFREELPIIMEKRDEKLFKKVEEEFKKKSADSTRYLTLIFSGIGTIVIILTFIMTQLPKTQTTYDSNNKSAIIERRK